MPAMELQPLKLSQAPSSLHYTNTTTTTAAAAAAAAAATSPGSTAMLKLPKTLPGFTPQGAAAEGGGGVGGGTSTFMEGSYDCWRVRESFFS